MAGILGGKIAFITGASSGIERATALVFTCEGASLVLAYRVEESGQERLARRWWLYGPVAAVCVW